MWALDMLRVRPHKERVQIVSLTQRPECPERADSHQRVLRLLKLFGYTANSFQVLQRQFEYWFSGDNACVAYVDTGLAWVAAGAPIAETRSLHRVALEFIHRGEALGRRVAFFGTESRFIDLTGFRSLRVGLQPSFKAGDWPAQVGLRRNLHRQLRRARAKGVCTEPLNVSNSDGRSFEVSQRGIETLIDQWLASKRLPPLGFLTNVQPFSFPDERRYFIAHAEKRLVGVAVMVPIYARRGWLLENLIRSPHAPNGTAESLIDAAVTYAHDAGDAFVTLGLTPLSGDVARCLRAAKHLGAWLYDFSGLEQFRVRLKPTTWSPVFLSFAHTHTAPLAVYDSLVAFAHGDLLQFGVQTVSRWLARAADRRLAAGRARGHEKLVRPLATPIEQSLPMAMK